MKDAKDYMEGKREQATEMVRDRGGREGGWGEREGVRVSISDHASFRWSLWGAFLRLFK